MATEPTDKTDKENYEKRIARLEKKIPGLGGIIKALEQSSPEFRQRISDTDAEIRHRIDVGWSSKPVVDYHVSTRPIRHELME